MPLEFVGWADVEEVPIGHIRSTMHDHHRNELSCHESHSQGTIHALCMCFHYALRSAAVLHTVRELRSLFLAGCLAALLSVCFCFCWK